MLTDPFTCQAVSVKRLNFKVKFNRFQETIEIEESFFQ